MFIFLLKFETFCVAVQKIHQNSKNGDFCEELLSENDFEAVLVNFCCYDYGANASEAVQKISTRKANFMATPMKNIFSSLLSAYWRCKPVFCFFPDKQK